MTFNAMPQSLEDRRAASLSHVQNMLNIINSLGSYSENPLPKYNYGGQANQLNTDVNKDFAATLLLASGGRAGALQRRMKNK